jgi:hypothetical protein
MPVTPRSPAMLGLAFVICLSACGSGGGSSASSGPVPSFTVSDSPNAVSISFQQGCASSPITVSVSGTNGFNGSVLVTISGLPSGATSSPPSPLTISANSSEQFTVNMGPATPTGTFTLTLNATSGPITQAASPITLTTGPSVETSESGGVMYLQTCSSGQVAAIGLDTAWGGSIVQVSLDGTNYVNEHDPGREVQPSLYDGAAQYDDCAGCTGVWGWNPVMAGDTYGNGSPVISSQMTNNSLYVKTQPLQWYPANFGGGPNDPIPSDCYFEQTVTVAPGASLAFDVHLTLTHFGTDQHYNDSQEFPAVYVNSVYGTLASYSGTAAWTNGAITTTTVPQSPGTPLLYSSENWAANVDSSNVGLTVFVPAALPYIFGIYFPNNGGSGPTGNATYYQHQSSYFTVGPGAVMEGDVYLIPGNLTSARSTVYALHQTLPAVANLSAPLGHVDSPVANATIQGTSQVSGWAFDSDAITGVEIFVDGTSVGSATYGTSRPDIPAVWPNAPVDCGWTFSLDSTTLTNGPHTVTVNATDNAGNVAIFPPIPVTVSN